MAKLDELWSLVRQIPKGRVASYGDIGKLLKHPASGFLVGRWMAQAPDGIPWWRVVAKTGSLPISKRGPALASEQEQRLRKERVRFTKVGQIDMQRCAWPSGDEEPL
jgi:methylated-DNA-protein-cysteine methyltransferase-like protein